MSGRGGNLKQPLKKVLINVPGPDNLGIYLEASTGLKMLQFKDHGFSLPWVAGSTIRVQSPVTPVPKISLFTFVNTARIDGQFGLNIVARHRRPGVQNSFYKPVQKYYGGPINVFPGTTITGAILNQMRNEVIAAINADDGWSQKYPHELPGAAVIAGIPLMLTSWNAASAMTLDGTSVSAGANIGAFVANINALPQYRAIATGASTITVIRTTRVNTAIAFVNSAGTIANSSADGQLGLIQRYPELTFDIGLQNNSLGTNVTLQNTRFPFLTNDEIFQAFSHIPNLGFLAQEVRRANTVLPGVSYVRLVIDIPMRHYDLGGASHANVFLNAVEVYMPATEYNAPTARWEGISSSRSMDAGTTATVRDLLTHWST